MNEPSLLIIGCGDLGERVGRALVPRGWAIEAVRRQPPNGIPGFRYHTADYADPRSLDFAHALRPRFVLATFTPATRDIAGYRRGFTEAAANLLVGLGEHRADRLIMVSSTRVYAEHAGGWVDESAPLSSTDERAVAIAAAEHCLLHSGQPVTVVRFAGLYGGPAGRLVARIAAGTLSPAQPLRYTNRIHRDDAAGFLVHLLTRASQGAPLHPVYNGVDDEPAPAYEVETWLARAMGMDLATAPHPAPEDHALGKRCSNALLRASGYQLQYPDYRAGYRQALNLEAPNPGYS